MAGALMVLAIPSFASDKTVSQTATNETARLISGDYGSPAWVNEAFTGTHQRTLTGNTLTFSIEQSQQGGGWDTAVSLAQDTRFLVSDVPSNAAICFDYDLKFSDAPSGTWWVGPKISVNWAAMTDAPSIGDWYENYVVETARQTPQELEASLFDYFDPVFLGESVINGATYRHIKLRYQDWWQYWSIRQDYRTSGMLDINPILKAWEGLPDALPFDGVKANIETHGPVSGQGTIRAEQSVSGEYPLDPAACQ